MTSTIGCYISGWYPIKCMRDALSRPVETCFCLYYPVLLYLLFAPMSSLCRPCPAMLFLTKKSKPASGTPCYRLYVTPTTPTTYHRLLRVLAKRFSFCYLSVEVGAFTSGTTVFRASACVEQVWSSVAIIWFDNAQTSNVRITFFCKEITILKHDSWHTQDVHHPWISTCRRVTPIRYTSSHL